MPTTQTLKKTGPGGRGCLRRDVVFDLLADDLTPERASSVREHLGRCPRCAELLEEERRFKARIDAGLATRRSSGRSPGCPEERVLCDYVDGVLSQAWNDLVRRHLECCPRCRDFVGLVRGEVGESEYFPMPRPEVLEAAAAIPHLLQAYRQRVEALNRLFASKGVFIEARLSGLPASFVEGPDEFQRHLAMVATLLSARASGERPGPIKAEVVLTGDRMEIGAPWGRFEFTRSGVSLHRSSGRVESGSSLEELVARHVQFDRLARHPRGLRLIGAMILRGDEVSHLEARPLARPVTWSDVEALGDRLKRNPRGVRLQAAEMVRKFYGQLQNRVERFDEREIHASEFTRSVHEASNTLESFGGSPPC
jgi:hypothetical protein